MFSPLSGHARAQRKVVESKKVEVVQTNGSLHTLSVYDSTRSVASPWWSVPPWNCLPQYPSFPQDVKEKIHVTHTLETSWTLLDESMNLYGYFQTNDTLYDLCWPIMHTHTHTSWTRFLISTSQPMNRMQCAAKINNTVRMSSQMPPLSSSALGCGCPRNVCCLVGQPGKLSCEPGRIPGWMMKNFNEEGEGTKKHVKKNTTGISLSCFFCDFTTPFHWKDMERLTNPSTHVLVVSLPSREHSSSTVGNVRQQMCCAFG